MDWREIKIYTTTEGIEPVTGSLLQYGIDSVKIEDANDFKDFLSSNDNYFDCVDEELMQLENCKTSVSCYVPQDERAREALITVKSAIDMVKRANTDHKYGSLEIEIIDIAGENWATEWKKYFKPIKVSNSVVIKPSWEEYAASLGETVIELDPGMAFGTGTHETTRMCIGLIEEFMQDGIDVLDVGCGSGILSVAAALLGAKTVSAIDIDIKCTEVAKENAIKNNCIDKMHVFTGDLVANLENKLYDIVVANIVADVICRLNKNIGAFLKPGGVYICSGILDTKANMVINSLKDSGFNIVKPVEIGEWRAYACEKE